MAHKEEIKVIHIHAVIRKRKSEGWDEFSNQGKKAHISEASGLSCKATAKKKKKMGTLQ